jgi:hypothetical protein
VEESENQVSGSTGLLTVKVIRLLMVDGLQGEIPGR